MSNILSFETKEGPQKGILTIYLLHSLKKKPKSGYDLLSEIKEKTQGAWVPSKGTIYPLLKKLHDDGLITIQTKDKRSKNIFMIAPKGNTILLTTKKQGETMMKKSLKFRNLIVELIGKDSEILSTMMQIQNAVFNLSKEKKGEVIKIMKRCALDLEKVVC